MALRIVFMGTPDFSVPTLEALHSAGHEIVACYSQPPRPAGRRGLELKKSPVHQQAEEFGIPVYTPVSLKSAEQQTQFAALNADVAVVIAYGLLLPKPVLDAPKFGCFNGHASLLPRWRGAAPIQRAIMAGDRETGVNIMQMDVGLDTGPVVLEQKVQITTNMLASQLHDELSQITADLMIEAMAALEAGTLKTTAQSEEGVTYAEKISKEETRIDWDQPAEKIHDHIRGLSTFPGAWCEMMLGGKPQRVKVLSSELVDGSGEAGLLLQGDGLIIACAKGAIRLLKVQRAGKQAQDAEDFLRGNRIEAVY